MTSVIASPALKSSIVSKHVDAVVSLNFSERLQGLDAGILDQTIPYPDNSFDDDGTYHNDQRRQSPVGDIVSGKNYEMSIL
jgi:hypothetical protein